MPYRAPAEFSWHARGQQAHVRRVAAAVVLVLAGWATGFFAGRMSAWLFPVIGSNTAAVTDGLARPSPRVAVVAPTNARPPVADEKPKTAAVPARAPAPAAETVQTERNRAPLDPPAAAGRDPGSADLPAAPNVDRAAAPAPDEAKNALGKHTQGGVVLVNPEWTQARPVTRQRALEEERERDSMRERESMRDRESVRERESMYEGAGFSECERRFSSFRRSDGTYQPYGRSSRELCPYLR